MKKSPLQRKTPLRSYSRLHSKNGLRKSSLSDTAKIKKEIQAVLRQIVMKRDNGCILRSVRHCGGDIGKAVIQADHLVTRANSGTYGDVRLVVCVCKPCHAWKSLGSNMRKAQYDALVKTLISKERVALWEMAEADSWKPQKMDWKLVLCALQAHWETIRGIDTKEVMGSK